MAQPAYVGQVIRVAEETYDEIVDARRKREQSEMDGAIEREKKRAKSR